jgi:cytochrome c553
MPRPVMARVLLACVLVAGLAPAATAATDFARDVQPILHARCATCHGGSNPQGNLTVLTRTGLLKGGQTGPAIVPGAGHRSLLIQRITGSAKGPRMPLNAQPLNDGEIQVLARWIDEGAHWDPGSQVAARTVPLKLSRPDAPGSFANSIDGFIEAYMQGRGKRMPNVASDEVFVRRVFLDVWGLPPTPEQRRSFLSDTRADKRDRLIETLLADRTTYAEHWMSYWNDLLHNDEGVRYNPGTRESISGWLLNALSTNLPYDQMVKALLNPSGEGAPKGYLVGISWGGDASASQSPPMQAAQNSAQVFLGANLKCASCHDSFVSRWKLAQTFGLAAFFSEKPLENRAVRCENRQPRCAAILVPGVRGY